MLRLQVSSAFPNRLPGQSGKHLYLSSEYFGKYKKRVIRNDRFNEGALVRAFEDGALPKLIKKLTSMQSLRS